MYERESDEGEAGSLVFVVKGRGSRFYGVTARVQKNRGGGIRFMRMKERGCLN